MRPHCCKSALRGAVLAAHHLLSPSKLSKGCTHWCGTQVTNNYVHDATNAGLSVYGCYRCLLAYNTLVNVGTLNTIEVKQSKRMCSREPWVLCSLRVHGSGAIHLGAGVWALRVATGWPMGLPSCARALPMPLPTLASPCSRDDAQPERQDVRRLAGPRGLGRQRHINHSEPGLAAGRSDSRGRGLHPGTSAQGHTCRAAKLRDSFAAAARLARLRPTLRRR